MSRSCNGLERVKMKIEKHVNWIYFMATIISLRPQVPSTALRPTDFERTTTSPGGTSLCTQRTHNQWRNTVKKTNFTGDNDLTTILPHTQRSPRDLGGRLVVGCTFDIRRGVRNLFQNIVELGRGNCFCFPAKNRCP